MDKIDKMIAKGCIKTREQVVAYRERITRNDSKTWQWRLTFCGMTQQHNYYAYYVLDQCFACFPHVKSIVELGTGNGAITIVLGLWGVKLGIPVLSLDRQDKCDHKILDRLGVTFVQCNMWRPERIQLIKDHIGKSPTFMFCDGGNKANEIQYWAPLLKEESIIMVHDWGAEIGPHHVAELEKSGRIVRFGNKEILGNKMNHQLAIWEVR